MTPQDPCSLNDVYKILHDPDTNKQTSYVLQFLWRDLSSIYDIVGPYFTCSNSVEGKFVIACVFETIKLFQFHGLKTSLLVCNGGPANIAAIKASHRHHGTYSVKDSGDKFKVETWMINPPHQIFWLICPSHQVCNLLFEYFYLNVRSTAQNMINELFSSKENDTKQFNRGNDCTFGWKSITDLCKCELARASCGQARMVPRLKEACCLRT